MHDDHDRQAIATLIARIAKNQFARNRQKRIRQRADKLIAEFDKSINTTRRALAAFDFDPSDGNLFEKVKAAIGKALWNEAVDRGQMAGDPDYVEEDDDSDTENDREAAPSTANEEPDEPKSHTSVEDAQPPMVPSVREMTLSFLAEAGEAGARAKEIQANILNTYGKELHEKTVGMTLYRLSNDGQVRREGRTWFLAPAKDEDPNAETRNPGGETPGHSSVFD